MVDQLGAWLFDADDAATAPDTNVTISSVAGEDKGGVGGSGVGCTVRELRCELDCEAMAHFLAQNRKFRMTGGSTLELVEAVMKSVASTVSGAADGKGGKLSVYLKQSSQLEPVSGGDDGGGSGGEARPTVSVSEDGMVSGPSTKWGAWELVDGAPKGAASVMDQAYLNEFFGQVSWSCISFHAATRGYRKPTLDSQPTYTTTDHRPPTTDHRPPTTAPTTAAAASAGPNDENWRIESIGGPATDDDWFPEGQHGGYSAVQYSKSFTVQWVE